MSFNFELAEQISRVALFITALYGLFFLVVAVVGSIKERGRQ